MITSIYNWFYNDYSRLDGRLRILFFTLLFPLAYKQLIVIIPLQVLKCPQELYHPEGLFALILGSNPSVTSMYQLLCFLKYPFILIWMFCIVGLGGRLSYLFNAIFTFIFWGAHTATSGTGHFWHVPMYVFFILSFTSNNDIFSLDSKIAKYLPNYWFKPTVQNDNSSFGRKLILITVVFTFFSAGISKISLGGIQWLNGESLYYYIKNLNRPRFHLGESLFHFLIRNKLAVTFLSVLTILFEIGFIITLFIKKHRNLFILGACAFHIGILLILTPIYIPQMICYLLILDWNEIWKSLKFKIPKSCIEGCNKLCLQRRTNILETIIISSGSLYVCLLMFVIIRQKEWFPFTHVPMYSTAIHGNNLSELKFTDFNNLSGLITVLETVNQETSPDIVPYLLGKKCFIYKYDCRSCQKIAYEDTFFYSLPNNSLWNHALSKSLAKDINYIKDYETGKLPKPQFPNTQKIFEAAIKNSLHLTNINNTTHFELTYYFNKNESITLALYQP